jgi:hypothetical protein
MTSELYPESFAHMRWADTRAREALRDSPAALVERALELYCHILGAEHVWLTRLRGEKPALPVMAATFAAGGRGTRRRPARRVRSSGSPGSGTPSSTVMSPTLNSAGQQFTSRVGHSPPRGHARLLSPGTGSRC